MVVQGLRAPEEENEKKRGVKDCLGTVDSGFSGNWFGPLGLSDSKALICRIAVDYRSFETVLTVAWVYNEGLRLKLGHRWGHGL